MIIGISGKISSGKDTVGKIIQYFTSKDFQEGDSYNTFIINQNLRTDDIVPTSSWQIKKFAYKLKQIVSLLTNVSVEDLEKQEVKDRVLGMEWQELHTTPTHENTHYTERTVRWLLQAVGTDAMRDVIHPNIWVNALLSEYKSLGSGVTYAEDYEVSGKTKLYDKGFPNWIITDVRFPNEADAILEKGGVMIRINRGKVNPCVGHNQHPSETALDSYSRFTEIIENNGSIEELTQKVKTVLQKHKII